MSEENISAMTSADIEGGSFDFEAELAKQFEADVAALPEEENSLTEDLAEYASGFPAWDLEPPVLGAAAQKKRK